MTKICTKCGKELPIEEFNFVSDNTKAYLNNKTLR